MKIKSVLFLLIIALLFVSTGSVVLASTQEFNFSVSPGETLTRQIRFDNTGYETAHNVRATEYGTAESWVSPDWFHFGDVAPGESSNAQSIYINVPQNVKPGETYDIWYSFVADEGDTGGKIHIIFTIESPDNKDDPGISLDDLPDNWILILIAGGIISTITAVAWTKKGRKPSDDNLSVSHSPSNPTETPIELSEQEIPPPPPDFSPDMPPPPPRPEGVKSEGEKHLEKVIDQNAEELSRRRGQYHRFEEERKQLIDERPPFLSKYDAPGVDPHTLMSNPDGDDRRFGGYEADIHPPFGDYERAVEYAKYQGKATTIPKSELGKLSATELEWYNKWRQHYLSYERRLERWRRNRPPFWYIGGGAARG